MESINSLSFFDFIPNEITDHILSFTGEFETITSRACRLFRALSIRSGRVKRWKGEIIGLLFPFKTITAISTITSSPSLLEWGMKEGVALENFSFGKVALFWKGVFKYGGDSKVIKELVNRKLPKMIEKDYYEDSFTMNLKYILKYSIKKRNREALDLVLGFAKDNGRLFTLLFTPTVMEFASRCGNEEAMEIIQKYTGENPNEPRYVGNLKRYYISKDVETLKIFKKETITDNNIYFSFAAEAIKRGDVEYAMIALDVNDKEEKLFTEKLSLLFYSLTRESFSLGSIEKIFSNFPRDIFREVVITSSLLHSNYRIFKEVTETWDDWIEILSKETREREIEIFFKFNINTSKILDILLKNLTASHEHVLRKLVIRPCYVGDVKRMLPLCPDTYLLQELDNYFDFVKASKSGKSKRRYRRKRIYPFGKGKQCHNNHEELLFILLEMLDVQKKYGVTTHVHLLAKMELELYPRNVNLEDINILLNSFGKGKKEFGKQ